MHCQCKKFKPIKLRIKLTNRRAIISSKVMLIRKKESYGVFIIHLEDFYGKWVLESASNHNR